MLTSGRTAHGKTTSYIALPASLPGKGPVPHRGSSCSTRVMLPSNAVRMRRTMTESRLHVSTHGGSTHMLLSSCSGSWTTYSSSTGWRLCYWRSLATLRASNRSGALPWVWLVLFGLVHGLSEWLDMLALSLGDGAVFSAVRVGVMTVSFMFLLEFARGRLAGRDGPGAGALDSPSTPGGRPGQRPRGVLRAESRRARHTFGLVGGLWAAGALYRASRAGGGSGGQPVVGRCRHGRVPTSAAAWPPSCQTRPCPSLPI